MSWVGLNGSWANTHSAHYTRFNPLYPNSVAFEKESSCIVVDEPNVGTLTLTQRKQLDSTLTQLNGTFNSTQLNSNSWRVDAKIAIDFASHLTLGRARSFSCCRFPKVLNSTSRLVLKSFPSTRLNPTLSVRKLSRCFCSRLRHALVLFLLVVFFWSLNTSFGVLKKTL